MFFIKKILIITAVLAFFGTYYKLNKEDIVIIPDKSLRFRVIANSDTLQDYILKTDVKNSLEEELTKLLAPAKNLDETKEILNNNLENLNEIIDYKLKDKDMDYNINLGNNYFPKKVYSGVEYPEGEYDSLVVTLGKGAGNNWWCVLFPPLCLLENDEKVEETQYKFYVARILDYFK